MPAFEKRGGRAAVVPSTDPRPLAGTVRAVPLCSECVEDYAAAVRGAPYTWEPAPTGLFHICEYCGELPV